MNPGSLLIDLYRINNFDLVKTKLSLLQQVKDSLVIIKQYEFVSVETEYTKEFNKIVAEARLESSPDKSVYDHFCYIYQHDSWRKEHTFLMLLHLKTVAIELGDSDSDLKSKKERIATAVKELKLLYEKNEWFQLMLSCVSSLLIIMGTGKLFAEGEDLEIGGPVRPRSLSREVKRYTPAEAVIHKNEPNWHIFLNRIIANMKAGANFEMELPDQAKKIITTTFINDAALKEVEYQDPVTKATQTERFSPDADAPAAVQVTVTPGEPARNFQKITEKGRENYVYKEFNDIVDIPLPQPRPWQLAAIAGELSNFLLALGVYTSQNAGDYNVSFAALVGLIGQNWFSSRLSVYFIITRLLELLLLFPSFVHMYYVVTATKPDDIGFDNWPPENPIVLGFNFRYRTTTEKFTATRLNLPKAGGLASVVSLPWIAKYFVSSVMTQTRSFVTANNMYREERQNIKRTKFTVAYLLGLKENQKLSYEEDETYGEWKVAARLKTLNFGIYDVVVHNNLKRLYPEMYRHPTRGMADTKNMIFQFALPYIAAIFLWIFTEFFTPAPPSSGNLNPMNRNDWSFGEKAPFYQKGENLTAVYEFSLMLQLKLRNITMQIKDAAESSIRCDLNTYKVIINDAIARERKDELRGHVTTLQEIFNKCTGDNEHKEEVKKLLKQANDYLNPPVLKAVAGTVASASTKSATNLKRGLASEYMGAFTDTFLCVCLMAGPALIAWRFGFNDPTLANTYFQFGLVSGANQYTTEVQRTTLAVLFGIIMELTGIDFGPKKTSVPYAYFIFAVAVLFVTLGNVQTGMSETFSTKIIPILKGYGLQIVNNKLNGWPNELVNTVDLYLRYRPIWYLTAEWYRIWVNDVFFAARTGEYRRTTRMKRFKWPWKNN